MARYVHPHFQRNSNELRDWSYDDAKEKYATAGAGNEGRRPGGDRQVPGEEGLGVIPALACTGECRCRRDPANHTRPSKLRDGSRAQGPG